MEILSRQSAVKSQLKCKKGSAGESDRIQGISQKATLDKTKLMVLKKRRTS
jgi:hypothetical protein